MRRTMLVAVIGLLPVGSALAQQYGMAGCGLGSMLFKDNTKIQILANTTNGTSSNQTFGITSGTSNCTAGGAVTSTREQSVYAEVNLVSLSQEMASGGGEYLAGMATLLGCEDPAQPAFFRLTQARYETIFPSEKTTSTQMLGSLKAQMRQDSVLSKSCTRI